MKIQILSWGRMAFFHRSKGFGSTQPSWTIPSWGLSQGSPRQFPQELLQPPFLLLPKSISGGLGIKHQYARVVKESAVKGSKTITGHKTLSDIHMDNCLREPQAQIETRELRKRRSVPSEHSRAQLRWSHVQFCPSHGGKFI